MKDLSIRICRQFVILISISSSFTIINGSASGGNGKLPKSSLSCYSFRDDSNINEDDGNSRPDLLNKDTKPSTLLLQCSSPIQFCYSLWKSNIVAGDTLETTTGEDLPDINNDDVEFVKQGCWENSPRSKCLMANCTTTIFVTKKKVIESDEAKSRSLRSLNSNKKNITQDQSPATFSQPTPPSTTDHHFCCCNSPGCNSVVYLNIEEKDEEEEIVTGITNRDEYMLILVILFVLTSGLIGYAGYYCYWRKRQIGGVMRRACKGQAHKVVDPELNGVPGGGVLDKLLMENTKSDSTVSADFELGLSCIVLGNEIARGKYGRVHNGLLNGHPVALKLYNQENFQFYSNEKWIYSQMFPNEKNSNILEYYGWQEFGSNLVIALERILPGNLRDLLQISDLNLEACLKLIRGISNGLGYLHGGNCNGITIAHRDLNSRNILVDNGFNVKIADFGLSLTTVGHKYSFNGMERVAEFSSLAEAGTLRYMAPELLEGAVNLKDCENALKQADVYSLALVLWETCNTCSSLHVAEHNTQHSLPYEIELGKELSSEMLTRFVVTRRDRPSFSTFRSSALTRTIRDTLCESWDSEPDARLTALCIHQRLLDLRPNLDANCSDLVTPLEPALSNWTGRNPLLERNLYSSTDSSNEYLIMSQKQMMGSSRGQGGQGQCGGEGTTGDGGSTVESQDTTHTELSNNNNIQFFNNLR